MENAGDDTDLIRRLHAGEERAFAEVYRQFHQRLYFFAQRFVGDADAKDVVSESFVALWHKRTGFSDLAAVGKFLFVSVRNRCLNVVRDQGVERHRHAELLGQLEASDEGDLYSEELLTGLVALIHAEIAKLPPRVREIFLLSFREGLTPSAIALRLELSVQTVKNQKLTAIRLLQQALGVRGGLLAVMVVVGV